MKLYISFECNHHARHFQLAGVSEQNNSSSHLSVSGAMHDVLCGDWRRGILCLIYAPLLSRE